MQATRSATTKSVCAALTMAFAIPAALLLAPGEAHARKLIIWYIDSIEPVAILSPNGRHIELGVGGNPREVENGTSVRYVLLVFQEETGAYGIGHGVAPRLHRDDPPGGFVIDHKVSAIGGRRFAEGPATAMYFAEERFRGKVVREWSHTEEVLLLSDEP